MDAPEKESQARQRWFRFGLRTLLVLVTIACAGFGWLGYKMRRAARQREAVKTVRELGGVVKYDYERAAPNDRFVTPPPVPIWLWEMFGADFFANVAFINFEGPHVTDAALEQLRAFTELDGLGIGNSRVTDDGLFHLHKFTRLRALDLQETRVTDAGLVHLQGLSQLDFLILRKLPQTEAGFAHLQKLTNLKFLLIEICADEERIQGRDELQRSLPNLRIVEVPPPPEPPSP